MSGYTGSAAMSWQISAMSWQISREARCKLPMKRRQLAYVPMKHLAEQADMVGQQIPILWVCDCRLSSDDIIVGVITPTHESGSGFWQPLQAAGCDLGALVLYCN